MPEFPENFGGSGPAFLTPIQRPGGSIYGGASQSRVFERFSGENGVRKLAICADRRGPALESRPAHESLDFGPTRTSALSGDSVGRIRKSEFRDLVENSSWGGVC